MTTFTTRWIKLKFLSRKRKEKETLCMVQTNLTAKGFAVVSVLVLIQLQRFGKTGHDYQVGEYGDTWT
ncbi:hypothetical protein Phum_PHUM265450 [Pediculus humanus corporis]|uniref:Uncharacterized protein n=1 Tax=Pediculus humanus subsp. corporis TaxID=121224 RepID=E0VKI7_PEDHC|nr:uncharacterized protein Phum_PHUM265450 [Pediculus humanus corporis]EEB13893.1 hypothetical protein Phum_PHUM265450 [Pediculus humanus corporis]